MIMTTKMKTEAAAMISCYDNKKKYDMYCKKAIIKQADSRLCDEGLYSGIRRYSTGGHTVLY